MQFLNAYSDFATSRHGKSGKSSARRFAFSNFRHGEIPNLSIFLDFSTSTARLLDTFSMSDYFTSETMDFLYDKILTEHLQVWPSLVGGGGFEKFKNGLKIIRLDGLKYSWKPWDYF